MKDGSICRSISLSLSRRLYGGEFWGRRQSYFLPIVRGALADVDGAVVDAACGAWNPYLAELDVPQTIGIDLDDRVWEWNRLHADFLIQDLHEEIALSDIGAVVSINTWEHLHSPEIVMQRFAAILKEGGIFVIVAPQRYHYISILTLLMPQTVQDLAWRMARGRGKMPFPVFYKLCSRRALTRAARASGFELVQYRSYDLASEWFLSIPPVFLVACGWMSLVNSVDMLSPLRSSFVAVLRKGGLMDREAA